MIDDAELLRRYSEEGSESAFAELVQRHLGLVYAAALRQLGGATHRAEEVTQLVFIALARKAGALARHGSLAGWLYTSTHYAAAKMKRTEQRRGQREREAFTMNDPTSEAARQADWSRLRPVLDEAMHELDAGDREVLVLRFFQSGRFAALGKEIGVSEDAARMRVERALARLRAILARRQITSTTAALTMLLANPPAVAVPPALAASVTAAALASGSLGLVGAATLISMKTKTAIGLAVAAVAVGLATYEWRDAHRARATARAVASERDALHGQLADLQSRLASSDARWAELQRPPPARSLKDAAAFAVPPPPVPRQPAEPAAGWFLATPEQARAYNSANVDTRYAAFYRERGWTDAQRAQFRALLLEREESGQRLFESAVATARARNPQLDRAGRFEIFEATQVQLQAEELAEVRRMFGDAVAGTLESYQDTLPMRFIVNQLTAALGSSSPPLTTAQSDQLTALLAQHARSTVGKVETAALDVDAAVAHARATGLLNETAAAELQRVALRSRQSAAAERARNLGP